MIEFDKELFSVIPGYSNYIISRYGVCLNIKTGREIKVQQQKCNKYIAIFNDSHIQKVLRLGIVIARTFIDNPKCCTDIVFKDGNSLNCFYHNINWDLSTGIIDGERWEDIKGFPNYQISDHGRIKYISDNKSRIIKPNTESDIYYRVTLYNSSIKNCKANVKIHQLVAKHFVYNPDPERNNMVLHIDDNKHNNLYTNLKWGNAKDNMNMGAVAKKRSLSNTNGKKSKGVNQYDISGKLIKTYPSTCEASRVTGINASQIQSCCKGDHFSCHGYIFLYNNSKWVIIQRDLFGNEIGRYTTAKEASMSIGIGVSGIRDALSCGNKNRIVGGKYRFEYYQIPNNNINIKEYTSKHAISKNSMIISSCLDKLNILYDECKRFTWLYLKRPMWIRFYLPKFKVGIEIRSTKNMYNDAHTLDNWSDSKMKLCHEHGIDLYYINYDEDIESKLMDILKSIGAIDNNVIRDSYSLW